jgi:hypothetical protein
MWHSSVETRNIQPETCGIHLLQHMVFISSTLRRVICLISSDMCHPSFHDTSLRAHTTLGDVHALQLETPEVRSVGDTWHSFARDMWHSYSAKTWHSSIETCGTHSSSFGCVIHPFPSDTCHPYFHDTSAQ